MARILVVEDLEDIRMFLKKELEGEGYNVIAARDGYSALDILRSDGVDLITLDMDLPGIDGLEVINTLRHEKDETPIVIYTGYNSYKNNFKTWGADAYLMKSLDTSELKETVSKLLERQKQHEHKDSSR